MTELAPPARPYAGNTDSSIVHLARRRALEQPAHPAFVFLRDGEAESTRLTYAQLDAAARAMAVTLASRFRRGDRILVICPENREFIVCFFGCLYAGLLAVPAHPSVAAHDIARLDRIAQDCGAAGICIGQAGTERTISALGGSKTLRHLLCVTVADEQEGAASTWRATTVDRSMPAYIQYTSGSTGAPKAVLVSHGNLLHNQQLIEAGFGSSRGSTVVSWLPLYHDMGLIGQVLHPLYLGATSVLMPAGAFFARPARWLQAISDWRATCSGGPNFAYELCARRVTEEQMACLDLSCWDVAFTGAEAIRSDTLLRFAQTFAPRGFRRESFAACYGMAEATLFVASGRLRAHPHVRRLLSADLQQHRVSPAPPDDTKAVEVVGCGRAIGQDLEIVDPVTRWRCPPGRIGEIWIRGASVAQGYWNRPADTEATFRAHLAEDDAGPYLRTGDLGFVEDGELFVTGRMKDLIVIRGRHYYPHHIEAAVQASHPTLQSGVGAAFTISIQGEERLVVAHEMHRHEVRRATTEEILRAARSAVRSRVGVVLHRLVLVRQGTLLKTSSGKVRRGASRDAYIEQALRPALPAPRAALHEQ
jgi:acyl-CoA synthetase (AMP-forming)/AMP-acid ligase II